MTKQFLASALLLGAAASAEPGFLTESHVSVRSVAKKRDAQRRCEIAGLASFEGQKEWPEGASIMALQVIRSPNGRMVVNDRRTAAVRDALLSTEPWRGLSPKWSRPGEVG